MDSTRLVQSTTGSGAAVRAALTPTTEARRVAVSGHAGRPAAPSSEKPAGYGLPCAHCRTYYLASLKACPVCQSSERVSAVALEPTHEIQTATRNDHAVLDQERESFLREFKAKLFEAHRQINPAAYAQCSFASNGNEAHEPATVCRSCHDHLQSKVDLCEAALHMDLQEAAQVIYDAVWADPSDSSKTYMNAAQALLRELRKRAGLSAVFGSIQRLTH